MYSVYTFCRKTSPRINILYWSSLPRTVDSSSILSSPPPSALYLCLQHREYAEASKAHDAWCTSFWTGWMCGALTRLLMSRQSRSPAFGGSYNPTGVVPSKSVPAGDYTDAPHTCPFIGRVEMRIVWPSRCSRHCRTEHKAGQEAI